jgi:hypothetical protein
MLHIAGGIILAIIILAFLPYILALLGWVLIFAVACCVMYALFSNPIWILPIAGVVAIVLVLRAFEIRRDRKKQAAVDEYAARTAIRERAEWEAEWELREKAEVERAAAWQEQLTATAAHETAMWRLRNNLD